MLLHIAMRTRVYDNALFFVTIELQDCPHLSQEKQDLFKSLSSSLVLSLKYLQC